MAASKKMKLQRLGWFLVKYPPPLGVLIDLQSIADIDLFRSSSICQFKFKQTRAIMKDSNGILVHMSHCQMLGKFEYTLPAKF